MATFNKFNTFAADAANGKHNLGSDTLKILLTNTLPAASNAVKADLTEIAAGNGYSAGGATVGISSSTQSAGVYKLVPSGNVTFTASGGSIANFQYAVLYNSTPAAGPLIGWSDSGAVQTITTGNKFTVNLDATNGILQLT